MSTLCFTTTQYISRFATVQEQADPSLVPVTELEDSRVYRIQLHAIKLVS